MYEPKTKPNNSSVSSFLAAVKDESKREDCFKLLDLFTEITGCEAKMWGSSIVGFGSYQYQSKSGYQSEWMRTGFSPRAQALSLYIMPGFSEESELLSKLGKYKTGKSCLYVKRLSDIDEEVLRALIVQGFQTMNERYPTEE
ncbi:DUF1801 domain-containing protein [Aliidiomarina sp. B3213]|uniref:DUF1801 domain-containing protein n=1 Tax=Aliidiomarina sp. B3213 TaxID=2249757 RepID=UPI000DD08762|nr:DUF1801 domain-containing protein [Aliidiomarina sp. B3213]RTE87501.1 DUF1801 domain-containing protein [Aliidiomarina sp. B3213]TCZ92714.1 DUF1801 domain-containing protein [Lysobacter sp. N42]